MGTWLVTVIKEWRLLARDRTGLLLLFVMPAALVVVITLVQDNVLRQTSPLKITGAIVDQDAADASKALIRELEASQALVIIGGNDGPTLDEDHARQLVDDGTAQFYAVIPQGLTAVVKASIRKRMDHLVAGKETASAAATSLPEVVLYFDPAVSTIYRSTVNGAIRRAVAILQANYSMQFLGDALEKHLRRYLADRAGAFASQMPGRLVPPLESSTMDEPVVRIASRSTGPAMQARLPTAVQQNVPAWALFGMFFIVVPLSGALILERREGILDRLMTMPVSKTALILGKLAAYVGVCLVQFLCVVIVGKWLLPVLGTDALEIKRHLGAVMLVTWCSALAATGYGIMLGALARTSQQAGILGPVSIVIAAALGGIMVPVFAMPPVMQFLSQLSPLAWAHQAYMILMVRNGTLIDVWRQLIMLLMFFAATLTVALIAIRRD